MSRRLRNQEKYLTGELFERACFNASAKSDHEHCEFCFAKFVDGDMGYSAQNGKYWVCGQCFEDFKIKFKFVLK